MSEGVAAFTLLVNSSSKVFVSPLFTATWNPSLDSIWYIETTTDPRCFAPEFTTRPLDLEDVSSAGRPSFTVSTHSIIWKSVSDEDIKSTQMWGPSLVRKPSLWPSSPSITSVEWWLWRCKPSMGLCLMTVPSAHRFRGFQPIKAGQLH